MRGALPVLLVLASGIAHAEKVGVVRSSRASEAGVDSAIAKLERAGDTAVVPGRARPTIDMERDAKVQSISKALTTAKELYVDEAYEKALTLLGTEEQRSLPLLVATQAGRGILVQLNLWMGCLELASGRKTKAGERFRLALSLRPNARLDPALWPPDYVSFYEQVRSTKPGTGTLSLQLSPGLSSVRVDARLRATTRSSMTWTLGIGQHYLYVHRPGLGRFAKRVRIRAGELKGERVVFSRAKASELGDDALHFDARWLGETSSVVRTFAAALSVERVLVVTEGRTLSYDRDGRLATPKVANIQSQPGTATPLYKKWWVWTLVGVAAVGVGAGIWALGQDEGSVRGRFVAP